MEKVRLYVICFTILVALLQFQVKSQELSTDSIPELADSDTEVVAEDDTPVYIDDTPIYVDHTHDFHWEQFAVPAAVTIAAACFTGKADDMSARRWVQRQLANKTGETRSEADNYLQYLPAVGVFGLKLCGLQSEHNYGEMAIIMAMSYATFSILNNTLKYTIKEQRPDSGARNSFPSGHSGTVFAGAEMLRREYWNTNKMVGIAGYLCAAAVGYMRIYNNRHWFNDVVAGAAIGYMSTAFAYWLYPKIFRKLEAKHCETMARKNSSKMTCFAMPYASTDNAGLACVLTF